MDKDELRDLVFGVNGSKELLKILDYECNPDLSSSLQYTIAAQVLSKSVVSQSDCWEPPFNWNDAEWARICVMSYKQRIAYSVSFLSMEFKRLQYVESIEVEI